MNISNLRFGSKIATLFYRHSDSPQIHGTELMGPAHQNAATRISDLLQPDCPKTGTALRDHREWRSERGTLRSNLFPGDADFAKTPKAKLVKPTHDSDYFLLTGPDAELTDPDAIAAIPATSRAEIGINVYDRLVSVAVQALKGPQPQL